MFQPHEATPADADDVTMVKLKEVLLHWLRSGSRLKR
jgi:hypothetical protein